MTMPDFFAFYYFSTRFEMAKKGARIEPKAEGNMINLANKFTALSSNN